jgi:hypothetical protein
LAPSDQASLATDSSRNGGIGVSYDYLNCPIYITCRDRLADLKPLVDWLERAGQQRIYLVDNSSTYPPLLEYLEQTPHEVIRLDDNYGSRALWRTGQVPDEHFVLTDPDVVPTEDCPLDAVAHLYRILMRYRAFDKVALGLYLDDVPRIKSLSWERDLVHPSRKLAPGVFDSLSDTTFAMWRPLSQFNLKAIRLGPPYTARHLPWYRLNEPTEEDAYYLERANKTNDGKVFKEWLGSSWAVNKQ